jgi:UDP-glucose 4-epimerase
VVPTALGFDPRLQLLHEEDAVESLYRSLVAETGGIFNIAADGVVFLSQAVRMMGRVPLPLLLPAAQPTAALLRRLRVIDFPVDQLKLIVYGRVVSTQRARERLGFGPRFTTAAALEDLRANRDQAPLAEPEARPSWERELFEFIKKKASEQRVNV